MDSIYALTIEEELEMLKWYYGTDSPIISLANDSGTCTGSTPSSLDNGWALAAAECWKAPLSASQRCREREI